MCYIIIFNVINDHINFVSNRTTVETCKCYICMHDVYKYVLSLKKLITCNFNRRFEIYKKQKIANMKKRYNMLSLNPNKVTGINHCASQNSCAVIQKDVGVQVWHEDISKQDKSFLFVCNSFIDNNKNHAEIQVYIPEGTGSMRLVRYKKAKNKCCGTEVKFANKSVECTASTLLSVSRWLYGIDKLEQESNDR